MYVVAITGGIGSGKTTIANQFAALGIEVVDADVIAREVVEPGTPGLAGIADQFGPDVIDPSGQLDRRALRERVFSDPRAKEWLNALLHPLIRSEMLRQCAAARKRAGHARQALTSCRNNIKELPGNHHQ